MHPDGFAHEADLGFALQRLVSEVEAAELGLPGARSIDVVSLSLGYFHESRDERDVTKALAPLIRRLTRLGVTVVSAAGNFSTSRPFYPAALARYAPANAAPLISVGALNPDTSTALFSNEAPWVICYASGAAIASAYPRVRGSLLPGVAIGRRARVDQDNFCSGFALWSGTSFAAPAVAARIADYLYDDAGRFDSRADRGKRVAQARQALTSLQVDPELKLDDCAGGGS
jgi:subtilisin family serine protease